jgi:histidinol-phosphate phosphatase family protein
MTQAVILAGGKGTRLAAKLNGRPKCLVDVDGVPLLERQAELLRRYGVDELVLLVNHAADYVARFCEERGDFGMRVRLVDEGTPRGTAGAVLAALEEMAERFLVLYGDTLLNVDLGRLVAAHESAEAEATLFLHANDHPADSDLVEVDEEGWVRAFHGYPHDSGRYYANLVNAALYVCEKKALERWRDFRTPADFGKDLFPAMIAAGARVKGYRSFEYVKDVGTPERLERAEQQLRQGTVARASLGVRQRAVFVDRDGTLNAHRGHLRRAEDLELLPGVAEAVRRLNRAEYRVVLVTNQPVIARGEATAEEVRRIHDRLETELGREEAFLDAIYVCPHHPHGGYAGEVAELKCECECRKPGTGMVERAARELNIELSESWMVGDTTVDVEMARRAGVRSILVRTGEGGGDGKFAASAERVADSLAEAVDGILGEWV